MTPLISLVVPTYNRRLSVERLLEAASRQTLPAEAYEVIVSMDGSDDGTRELLDQVKIPFLLRYAWQPNQGRAAACNTGIHLAEGEVLVLVDDDMEPVPEFLAAHWQAHQAGSRLGVIGAAPIPVESTSTPVMRFIGAKFNQHLEKLSQPGYIVRLRDFYSGNFSIRREVLLQVGLFDEAFKIYGNEDLELFVRLNSAGVKVIFCPQALAIQHYEKNFVALTRDEFAKGRTGKLFIQKHPEAYPEAKISTYHQASWRWRLARAGLLEISQVWKNVPDLVLRLVSWIERKYPQQIDLYYRFVLDYFFWLGVKRGPEDPAFYR